MAFTPAGSEPPGGFRVALDKREIELALYKASPEKDPDPTALIAALQRVNGEAQPLPPRVRTTSKAVPQFEPSRRGQQPPEGAFRSAGSTPPTT